MEQFRQIGEVLGSLKAVLEFRDDIEINQRQCLLLFDLFKSAYDSIAKEMRNSLRFEEKNTIKWRILEQPLRDLGRVFREGEAYFRQCLEPKGLPAKVVTLHRNRDCVELHAHNLLACVPIVVEAIEAVGEISGSDQEEVQNRRRAYSCKYRKEFRDWRVFRWKFGKEYPSSRAFCDRFDSVWREDWWDLCGKFRAKKLSPSTKNEQQRLIDLIFKSFEPSEELFNGKLLPSSILLGSKDYQVRRRLGFGSQYKEITWLGESFALRHCFGDFEPLLPEISSLLSISHPNIVNSLCGFADEEKKEWFLIMELMSKDLSSYIKEICGPRKRIPFSIPVAVNLMLQIARGMEYLHSNRIYHGDLNPSNILVRVRANNGSTISPDGSYLEAKVSGFGLKCVKNFSQKSSPVLNEKLTFIWHAPEVLEEKELTSTAETKTSTEKSDIYSFGMVCFEVLTGKVPFEDGHLQGDKMSRNIRAGERPLFPFQVPKYLTSLTKKCWHTDPKQRPRFSSVCRILRYIKRFIAMNPDYNTQDPAVPMLDYSDIESGLLRNFPCWSDQSLSVSQIPFQMFVYRVLEREKTQANLKENSEESGSDVASICGDETVIVVDDVFPSTSDRKSLASPDSMIKKLPSMKKSSDTKMAKPGSQTGKSVRPPQINPSGRSMRRNSESQLTLISPRLRRTSSGHASDLELP